jgi:hypothetical protein
MIAFFLLSLLFQGVPIRQSQDLRGTVAGRVVFTNGSPGAGIRVGLWALPETEDQGVPSVQVVGIETDTRGRYQLEDIPPGRYYIAAGRIDSLTYFPGVTVPSRATIVTVNQGSTMNGQDFAIAPLLRVSGRLVMATGGRLNADALRMFAQRRVFLESENGKDSANTRLTPDGVFEFKNVRPGSYTVLFVERPTDLLPIVVVDKDIIELKLKLTN